MAKLLREILPYAAVGGIIGGFGGLIDLSASQLVNQHEKKLERYFKDAVPALTYLNGGQQVTDEALHESVWKNALSTEKSSTPEMRLARRRLSQAEAFFATYDKLTEETFNPFQAMVRRRLVRSKDSTIKSWTKTLSKKDDWMNYLHHRCDSMNRDNACRTISQMVKE